MKLRKNCSRILILAAVLGGSVAPVTAEDSDWSLKVTAVSSRSTSDLASASDLGVGVGAEVRLSRRLGLGLAAFTNEFNDELELDFFDFPIRLEQSFRMTPVLAELLWHLTPDSRADLYVGPVAGYVVMSDLTIRFSSPEIGIPEAPPIGEVTVPIDSQWAWGATLGGTCPGPADRFSPLKLRTADLLGSTSAARTQPALRSRTSRAPATACISIVRAVAHGRPSVRPTPIG
jgi:hypothetical protein